MGSRWWLKTCAQFDQERLNVLGTVRDSDSRREEPDDCETSGHEVDEDRRLGDYSVKIAACTNARHIRRGATDKIKKRDSQSVLSRIWIAE